MNKNVVWLVVIAMIIIGFFSLAISQEKGNTGTQKVRILKDKVNSSTPNSEKKGEYLVTLGGCNDCHSPKVMIQTGPQPDEARLLSGHPANDNVPNIPAGVIGPNGWGALASSDFTAWAGPWGISYTFNLTPDNTTGIGAWTPDIFIKAMRTGKHMGAGRPILPPMPWNEIGKATDEDLRAVFSYLKSLKPITNQVPQPVPVSEPSGKP